MLLQLHNYNESIFLFLVLLIIVKCNIAMTNSGFTSRVYISTVVKVAQADTGFVLNLGLKCDHPQSLSETVSKSLIVDDFCILWHHFS